MLSYLGHSYFHEDYDVEASSPLGVVEKFVDNEIVEYPLMLLAELDGLKKKGITEEEARNLWLVECGAYYEPDVHDGLTYLDWFDQIRDLLERRQVRGSE